jgi:hypothetical protein
MDRVGADFEALLCELRDARGGAEWSRRLRGAPAARAALDARRAAAGLPPLRAALERLAGAAVAGPGGEDAPGATAGGRRPATVGGRGVAAAASHGPASHGPAATASRGRRGPAAAGARGAKRGRAGSVSSTSDSDSGSASNRSRSDSSDSSHNSDSDGVFPGWDNLLDAGMPGRGRPRKDTGTSRKAKASAVTGLAPPSTASAPAQLGDADWASRALASVGLEHTRPHGPVQRIFYERTFREHNVEAVVPRLDPRRLNFTVAQPGAPCPPPAAVLVAGELGLPFVSYDLHARHQRNIAAVAAAAGTRATARASSDAADSAPGTTNAAACVDPGVGVGPRLGPFLSLEPLCGCAAGALAFRPGGYLYELARVGRLGRIGAAELVEKDRKWRVRDCVLAVIGMIDATFVLPRSRVQHCARCLSKALLVRKQLDLTSMVSTTERADAMLLVNYAAAVVRLEVAVRLVAAGDLTAIAPQAEPATAKAYQMLRWMFEQGCGSVLPTRLALEQGFMRDYELGRVDILSLDELRYELGHGSGFGRLMRPRHLTLAQALFEGRRQSLLADERRPDQPAPTTLYDFAVAWDRAGRSGADTKREKAVRLVPKSKLFFNLRKAQYDKPAPGAGELAAEAPPKRKPGRPRKVGKVFTLEPGAVPPPKRKPGAPRKNPLAQPPSGSVTLALAQGESEPTEPVEAPPRT